jgi:hypothetical protein
VVVTHIYRLIRHGEDVDHASYDTSAIHTTRLGIGGLKRFVLGNRARFKSHASSMHFSKSHHPQTRPDPETPETTTDADTQPASKTYHPLTFATDMSDDRDQEQNEKPTSSWGGNGEEADISPSPARVLVTQETGTASESAQAHSET